MSRSLAVALFLGLAQAGAVPVISEIMFHPIQPGGGEDPRGEWIEIHNQGFGPMDLSGWSLGGVNFIFPEVSIPDRGYLVVAADEASFRARYPEVTHVTGGWGGRLSNRGETIRLRDRAGNEIDRVTYANEGDWAHRRAGPNDRGHTGWIWNNPADGGGRTLELRNLHSRNDLAQNWAPSISEGGSPGAPNSAREVNVAPFIENVSHHPAVPAPQDLVLIRARLTDDLSSPVHGVVHHRISAVTPGSFAVTTMRDDGLGGDEVAQDNIHTAVLPARPEGTVVEFYVEAFDRTLSRTWPGPSAPTGTQEANLLYQVDSEQPSGRAPFYRLILSAGELDEFLNISFDSEERKTNARFNATFIAGLNGKLTTYYRCGMRLRGSGTHNRYPRNLKIELPSSQSWQGSDELNLNSQFPYNQLLGSLFYRAAGLPIYESKVAAVRLNGVNHASPEHASTARPFSHHFGMYVQNEAINSRYIRLHYPLEAGGNLYRMTGSGTGWDYFPDSTDLEADYRDSGWDSENSRDANAWLDLHRFIGVMSTASGTNYLKQVETVMDLEAWLRTLAVSTILTNAENSIFTGRNDDYALYCGHDGRFKLIPHDLDTILGTGATTPIGVDNLPHTIFDFAERGESFDQLKRLFREPRVQQRYTRILSELLHGPFEESRANRIIDNALTWTPTDTAEAAKEFLATRRANILSQIERPLRVATSPGNATGIPTFFDSKANFYGTFNSARATSVFLNGEAVLADHPFGRWAHTFKNLNPGINRIIIEERDAEQNVVARSHLDVFYDNGAGTTVEGDLTADTTLDAAGGPWIIPAVLNVLPGVTLTIEAGTSLFFSAAGGLTVQPGGTLRCEGSPYQRIRLGRYPGSLETWQGVSIVAPSGQQSTTENVISYTDMEHGDAQGEAIELRRSRLLLDHVTWDHSNDTVLEVYSPQLEIRDCTFPPVPNSKALQGSTLRNNDYLILRRNVFAPSPAYNDIIVFSGAQRPGPILAAYDNVFTGATDECFDLNNCDAHLEGNVFMHAHLFKPRNTTSNAIAINNESSVTVVRNLFYDVDHAVLLKNGANCTFENNTVVGATIAAINLDEPLRPDTLPGQHISMESNLLLDCNAIFAHSDSVEIIGHHNILPVEHHMIGDGNSDLNPFLSNLAAGPWPRDNWSLLAGSPAQGSGQNGLDRGALVPAGASVSGLPSPLTPLPNATLTVDGPGVTDYRFRLVTDDLPGEWSGEFPLATPIQLVDLRPATYRLEILARDSAGNWQDESEITPSREWQVAPGARSELVLNEVEARAKPGIDSVELHNPGTRTMPLTGWFLSDTPDNPQKVALTGTLAPGAYLTLVDEDVPGLSPSGEELLLYHDKTLVDSIRWGKQVPGYSIGRHGPHGKWTLCRPTPDGPNRPSGLTPTRHVKINEWLADSNLHYLGEFIEFFNPGDSPADLGGLWLSDTLDHPRRYQIPDHSYIPAGGFLVLHSTTSESPEAHEFPFNLNGFRQWLLLTAEDGTTIDQITITCQCPDIAEGRNPDGSATVETFRIGTPGGSNNRTTRITEIFTPLPYQLPDWRFLDNADPVNNWKTINFDDSGWAMGPAPLGRETSSLLIPLASHANSDPPFNYRRGRKNYYFRKTFEFDGDPSQTSLTLATYVDDGAVFYLNGHELFRHNVPEGALDESTWSEEVITNASLEGPFPVSAEHLVRGPNILAVVTYQASSNSSDIVFDCELTAYESTLAPPDPAEVARQVLLDHLRITEIMYNPPDGSAGEFIEIQNTSHDLTLDLTGVRFTEGIEFTFPPLALAPRTHIVVVADREFFELVHGPGINIAGTFEDGKLHNDSESVALTLPVPFDVHIQKFTYDHSWHPSTDSTGYSLEFRDPERELDAWNERSAWSPSFSRHGSPGFPNGASSYSSWARALGIARGDDDGDAMSNLFEYAFDFDPLEPQFASILFEQSLHPGEGSTSTFHVPAVAPADVIFRIQSSLDLKTWTTQATRVANGPWTGPGNVEAVHAGEGLGIVQIHLPYAPALFTRMQVEIGER
ncbi:MAG: lamin tail domain-containing protein [Roseibacillus sp.]|nr:lamin tail domain-containing protein [Roseibacillus sp.]